MVVTPSVLHIADEPYDRHASVHPVRIYPLLRGNPGSFVRALDQCGEPFMGVFVNSVLGHNAWKLVREEHGKSVIVDYRAARPRARLQ